MVEEARLEGLNAGLTAVTDGWFVVNVRDAAWVTNEHFGTACVFEGDDAPFAELGFTIGVIQPGQSGGLYHREANQEDFLVLAGECLLLVEGEERRLKAWDFVTRRRSPPRRTRPSRSGSRAGRKAGTGCPGPSRAAGGERTVYVVP